MQKNSQASYIYTINSDDFAKEYFSLILAKSGKIEVLSMLRGCKMKDEENRYYLLNFDYFRNKVTLPGFRKELNLQ